MAVVNESGEVRAAGGAVVRRGERGLDVLLVHRPRYDDWTLPKGKAEPGESDEDCARREVEEETGLRCTLGRELTTVRYTDRFGRPKYARYWEMEPIDGAFAPGDEVDEIRWVPLTDAASMLSYPRDADVLRMLEG
jgi:8-oxo-dGTP pyrophosphatase MutT (NUDIX family)